MKRIILLGSTGSIGQSTLEVVRKLGRSFRIQALSCHRNLSALQRQIREFHPEAAAITEPDPSSGKTDEIRWYQGQEGLIRMIEEVDCDLILNGIAGSAGLLPSLKALEMKKPLALANKESIVMGGSCFQKMATKAGIDIIPVDSEHSALFHLIQRMDRSYVKQLILTASGGPFREMPLAQLANVTERDALAHPTWNMGKKITIDSATMANKGLEVIEAMYLFGLPPDKIQVLIHPQSCVHSLVRTVEGSLYAQISQPDMRVPIQNALTFPKLASSEFGRLDLEGKELSFQSWDPVRFPLLKLAYQAASESGSAPVVYNAVNEIAVEAFLGSRIPFTAIAGCVEKVLSHEPISEVTTVDEIFYIDRKARETANQVIRTFEA